MAKINLSHNNKKRTSRKEDTETVYYHASLRPVCEKTGKRIWDSRAVAKTQAKRYQREKGAKMAVYFCECGGWHLGHRLYHKRATRRLNERTLHLKHS